MTSQITTLLALIVVLAFLARAYYNWRTDFMRRLRGPDSSSFLYGGYSTNPSPIVEIHPYCRKRT